MSVFLSQPNSLDLNAMRIGLGWAQSWTNGSVLCTLGNGWMRLIVAEPNGFLASWSWSSPQLTDSVFFLIPPFVARTISGPAAWDAKELDIMTSRNIVGLLLRDGSQEFRLQWRWLAQDFQSPKDFSIMSQLPDTLVSTPYINLADMVHMSMANLIRLIGEDESDTPWQEDGAILIDFLPGQINIDGESVTDGKQARYYFKPRMLMRGLEIVRDHRVEFAMRDINRNKNSILYLASQRENWQIHCAILSVSSPRLELTVPSMTIRETRPPMTDGSWFAQ